MNSCLPGNDKVPLKYKKSLRIRKDKKEKKQKETSAVPKQVSFRRMFLLQV